MRLALVFVAIVSLTACKKDPPVEDPGDLGMGSGTGEGSGTGTGSSEGGAPDDLIAAQGGQIDVLELLADAAAGGTPDCTKMAADMNVVLTDGEAKLHAMDGYTDEQVMAHEDELNDRFGARIDAAMAKLGDAIQVCQDDEAIVTIMKSLGLM